MDACPPLAIRERPGAIGANQKVAGPNQPRRCTGAVIELAKLNNDISFARSSALEASADQFCHPKSCFLPARAG